MTTRIALDQKIMLMPGCWNCFSLPEHVSSLPGFSLAKSLVFCVVICRSLFVLLHFLLLFILLSVLRFMAFSYTFCIFKLFSTTIIICFVVFLLD